LLRLVADTTRADASTVLLRADPATRLPGRGAWIHPTHQCLEQATRRRTFGRALRLGTGVDLSQVSSYIETYEVGHEEPSTQDDRTTASTPARGATQENRKRV